MSQESASLIAMYTESAGQVVLVQRGRRSAVVQAAMGRCPPARRLLKLDRLRSIWSRTVTAPRTGCRRRPRTVPVVDTVMTLLLYVAPLSTWVTPPISTAS